MKKLLQGYTAAVLDSDKERRIVTTVHLAFFSSIGVFALVLWIARRGGAAPLDTSGRNGAVTGLLLVLGIGEISWAGWFGRRLLARKSGDPLAHVRTSFYLRFAAAEAVAVFGLMSGFLGASALTAALFFAVSAAALFLAAPSREAWRSSMDAASR